jgi:hypothetical protein
MTMLEQIALANEKVAHWQNKQGHAQAMLAKWQSRLSTLRAKGKPVPTANKLPALTLVPGSERFLPRTAVVTKGDQAPAEHFTRQTALRDIAAEAGDDGKVINGQENDETRQETLKARR